MISDGSTCGVSRSCGEVNEAGEVDGSTIMAGRDAGEALEVVAASFDPVAMLVDGDGGGRFASDTSRPPNLAFHADDPLFRKPLPLHPSVPSRGRR